METNTGLDRFLSASSYTEPVDIKKLNFVYSAIERFTRSRGRAMGSLEILEVACDEGWITLPLATLGGSVTAFDINGRAVEILRAKIEREQIRNLTVTVDDGNTFDDGRTYDVVVASEVFEHVTDPERFAANVVQRMKEDGSLIVTVPNGYGPWETKNRLDLRHQLRKSSALRRMLGKPPYVSGTGIDHCQFYTRERLVGLLSRHALHPTDFGKSDSILTVFRPLRRSRRLGKIDGKLADLLPAGFASGWYFVFERER